MIKKLVLALTLGTVMLGASTASAWHIEYTSWTHSSGSKKITAEIYDNDGIIVASGVSSTEGTRSQKKKEAANEALEELEEEYGL